MSLDPATSLIAETNAVALHQQLRTTYPVSLRETELALLALSDTMWAAIAALRGTTRTTITTSYRQLSRKLGIHSRPDLRTLIITSTPRLAASPDGRLIPQRRRTSPRN